MVAYNNKVWFGTRNYMQWVSAPAVDIQAGKQGYANTISFLGGGAAVRRSKAGAKRYSMAWNMKHREDIEPILDYADGLYGNGYIYYMDPFAMDRNVLPAYLAAPYINYYDGPFVVDDTRPTLTTAITSSNGYPLESALYKLTASSKVPSVFVPIPEGHTLYIGAHGSVQAGNGAVTVTPWTSAVGAGTTVNLPFLSTGTTQRTNSQWSYANGVQGVTISLRTTSTGTLQLDGLIAQVAPDGAVLPSGGFISGQGSSGLSFASSPSVSQYSAALDRVGCAVELIETEAWAWQ